MKRLRLFVKAVPALLLAFLMTSCGQTYHMQSLVFSTPNVSIEGISNYATFKAMAQLSNGQSEDVTTKVAWSIAAPADAPGLIADVKLVPGPANQVQAIKGVCTWNWVPQTDSTGKVTGFGYSTDPFTITATYQGMTAQGTVNVDSLGGCYDPTHPAPTSDPGYTGPAFGD